MLTSILIFSGLAVILSTVLIPVIIKVCKAYSLYDSVNARKIHSGNIPRLGGIAIAVSFIISATICFLVDKELSFVNAIPLLLAGMIIFFFGVLDDIIELRAIFKLMAQLIAVGIVVGSNFRFRQIFGYELPGWFSGIFTFFWVLGIINAYNLIDGLDGLCGTLSFTACVVLGFVLFGTYNEGTAICFILAASVLGFLFWNWPHPNAKIFMGDNGSQFLGFMIAMIPLYSTNENIEFNKLLMMLVIVSFPMLDTFAAIWRRLREHRPIMSPDKAHLHHKLLNLGFDKKHALYMVLSIQILICLTVAFSLFLTKIKGTVLLGIAYLFMICFFMIIHYTNRAVMKKINNANKDEDDSEEVNKTEE